MDTLIDLPPLPSTATSPPPRKRRVSAVSSPVDADDDGETPPPAKKRAPRSSAAEKAAKKQARMERNRIAAQASRDRKRQQNEFLEARVAELEAQLQAANSHVSPSSSTPFRAPLSLVAPSTSFGDPQVAQLQEENEALKTQLALEKLQSQSLQIRLSALETKFGRLEQLLVKTSGGGEEASPQGVKVEPKEQHTMEQEQENEKEQEDTDNSRLVAREVESSLQRKLSSPSSTLSLSLPLSTLSPRSLPPTTPSPPSSSPSPTSTRPTLHQILSAIRIRPSSATMSSVRRGAIGRLVSSSTVSSSRRNRRASRSSTSSSFCAKTLLRGRQLRLYVRR